MKLQSLQAQAREDVGKTGARDTRNSGKVPSVLYGGGQDTLSVSVDAREFDHLVHGRAGEHAIVQLEIEDKPDLGGPALLKAVQHHPIRGDVLHADFQRIRLDERLITSVPLVLTGQARGVVEGGVLDHQLREVEVECLALEVPEELTIDVTELEIGQGLHVSDLVAPENVTIVTDVERAIVAVHAPRLLRAAEEEEAEAAEGEEGEGEEGEEKAEETEPEGAE